MIEDCKYVLIPVHKDGEGNRPLYFHNSKEIVAFLKLSSTTEVSRALCYGRKLKRKYFVDLNAAYVFDKDDGSDEQRRSSKVVTDIYGLL